jgi:hypothetical protein
MEFDDSINCKYALKNFPKCKFRNVTHNILVKLTMIVRNKLTCLVVVVLYQSLLVALAAVALDFC